MSRTARRLAALEQRCSRIDSEIAALKPPCQHPWDYRMDWLGHGRETFAGPSVLYTRKCPACRAEQSTSSRPAWWPEHL